MTDQEKAAEAAFKAHQEGSTKLTQVADVSDLAVTATNSVILPEKRNMVYHRPGTLNLAHSSGHYPGCKLVLFEEADQVNEFFLKNGNLLVVDIKPVFDSVAVKTSFAVVYTNQLDDVQIEVMQQLAIDMQKREDEIRAEILKREESEEAEEKRKDALLKELAEDGMKYRKLKWALYKKARKAGMEPVEILEGAPPTADEAKAAAEEKDDE